MVFKKGVSLVELISALAIVGLISMLAVTLYFAQFRLFTTHNTAIDIFSQNKIALNEIEMEIKEGESIVNTCTNCAGDTTTAALVIVRLWPLDANSEPQDPIGTNYDYVIYKRDPQDFTRLVKKTIPGTGSSRVSQTNVIAVSISNLQFTYDNADPALANEVTVTITTTATTNGKTQTATQSTKAVLRNK